MNGASTEFCAKIKSRPNRIITIKIGISHHFLRTRMKAQSSERSGAMPERATALTSRGAYPRLAVRVKHAGGSTSHRAG